ncbi:MAG: hypothetical protein IPP29_03320 [Bacteroidetes bacterium]|nr:hypothetical protein [Bacteroidota bacterium]
MDFTYKVNQDIISNNKNQYFPTIACDPITGNIAIGYLDSRDNHPQENYYVSLSADEGQSWYDYQVSDASFVSTSGTANDYTWLDIKNNYIVPVWNENILDPSCTVPVYYDNAFTSPFSIACTTDVNNLCNINESGSQFFKASNTISVAGNPSNCYYNILASGGNVAFQAGNNVKLAEGFHSEYGKHAFIYQH